MLVIQRKEGQSILVDDKIKITVAKVNGNSVKLAINAPKDVRIKRVDEKELEDGNNATKNNQRKDEE